MADYKVYHCDCFQSYEGNQEESDQQAIRYAQGMVWAECESSYQSIAYTRAVDVIDGVGVWYDFGADYYFFTDESEG